VETGRVIASETDTSSPPALSWHLVSPDLSAESLPGETLLLQL